MKQIRGVVFDLDGVLMDSSRCHREAFEEVLADFSVTGFVYENYAGWRTPDVFRMVFADAGKSVSDADIDLAAQRKSRLARERMAASDPIDKHCLDVLSRLSLTYRLALASSGSRPSIEWFLDTSRCRSLFLSVLSGNDVLHAKPAPEIYTRSFQALALEPEECAVIEDAVAGIAAGRAAGGRVIGLSGTCSPEVLRNAGADLVISCLPELLHLKL